MTAGLGSGLCERVFARLGRRRGASDERGFTLIEMVITVWILGAVMVAFCGALFTMVHASSLQQQRALGETELRHLAEAVRSEPYIPCEEVSGLPVANGSYQSSLGNYYTAAAGVSNPTVQMPKVGGVAAGYWDRIYDNANGFPDQVHTFTVANQPPASGPSITFDTALWNFYGVTPPFSSFACVTSTWWDFGAQKLTLSLQIQGVTYTEDVVKRNTAPNFNANY